jgi:RHS repeat-associated protein
MKYRLTFLFFLPFFLFAEEHILPLGELGSVRYSHENQRLNQIDRLSANGEILYSHTYNYDEQGQIISESLIGNLGDIQYGTICSVKSPYHLETGEYDSRQNLVKHTHDETVREYEYNGLNELVCEDSSEYLEYDSQGNLIQKGDVFFTYDDNHRLIKFLSPHSEVTFVYDAEGNRVSKTSNGITERYLFSGINELAILDEAGMLKELRIPGLSMHPDLVKAIAIETPTAIYAPIHDIQGNIVKLIDIFSREVTTLTLSDPFGRGLSTDSPTHWIYRGKHYDPETGLIYFGHRFYCPSIKKWLTPDPAFQASDPYQYCLNNPLSFFDPDGKFAFAVPLINIVWGATTVITCPIWGPAALATAATAAVGYAGYKGVQHYNQRQYNKEQRAIEQKLAEQRIFPDIMEKNDGCPESREVQDKQFNDAKKEVERNLGRKLTYKEVNEFHHHVSGQGYNYQELVLEGKVIFHGK